MDPEQVLSVGERGIHVLFENPTITAAFGQDADNLRRAVSARPARIQRMVKEILALPDAGAARDYISALPRAYQYVLVLLYFELLDGRMRRKLTLH